MSADFEVSGTNAAALFTLKVHRGDGMALLAMNWKHGQPPDDFVGFGIEYKEPAGTQYWAVNNRLRFPGRRRCGGSQPALDAPCADPEVPLGALPAQRGPGGRLHLPRDAGLHEQQRTS